MLFSRTERTSLRSVVRLACLAFVTLFGCANAGDPELFQADPLLLNDFTSNLPARGRTGNYEYEIIQGLAIFEGDILLGTVDAQGTLASRLRGRGLGRSDTFGRWPDGIVPYLAPTKNSDIQQENIYKAIAHWMENTSITFVERTAENKDQYPNYIRFDNSNSCASYVGMRGGEQSIMVSDRCSMGSIVHELGHALGLFHEHTRPDRDNYATIDWDQIVSGKEINFNILTAGVQNLGPYDYGSIMHYGEFFFSSTGNRTIIVPDGIEIGQREALSELDKKAVNQMYATDLALFEPVTNETENGIEISVSALNQGMLGAQLVELSVEVASDSLWKGISEEADWDCVTYDAELRCTRPTLPEMTETSFTLLVDTGSGTIDDLSMLLTSRTTDTNPANNTFNHDGIVNEEVDKTETDPDPNIQALIDQFTSTPTETSPMAAAAKSSGYPPSNDAAGGGSDNGVLAALCLCLLRLRMRLRMKFSGSQASSPGKS